VTRTIEKVWYDLNPFGELCVVEGAPGHDICELDPEDLPPGFRRISVEEWEREAPHVEVVEWAPSWCLKKS
jgi:hypothetical protein